MSADSPIRYATSRDGTKIAWTERGEGPSIIFVHPWPVTLGPGGFWASIVQRSFNGRVIYFDRRGFGKSDWNVEHSFDLYADDLEAVADAAGFEDIVLYAAAFGCSESIQLASRSARVTRMYLGAPSLTGSWWFELPANQSLLALLDIDFRTFWRVTLQNSLGWNVSVPQLEQIVDRYVASTNQADTKKLLLTIKSLDLRAAACTVSAECLLVYNKSDSIFDSSQPEALGRLLPNVTVIATEGGRWSASDDLGPSVNEFLGGSSPRTHVAAKPAQLSERHAPLQALSEREKEVLALVADGMSNPEIAAALTISHSTASRHVHNILGKLGVRSRAEAAAWAARHEG